MKSEITVRRDVPCLLMNPWKENPVRVIESNSGKEVAVKLDHINGECIVFHTKPGVTYLIQKKNLI